MNLVRIFTKYHPSSKGTLWQGGKIIRSFGEGNMDLKRKKQAEIAKQLRESLQPTYLQVIDTSIGSNSCGMMYRILIESKLFDGKSKVEQHRMVTEALKDHIKTIHGFSLKTKVTESQKTGFQLKTQSKQQKNSSLDSDKKQ